MRALLSIVVAASLLAQGKAAAGFVGPHATVPEAARSLIEGTAIPHDSGTREMLKLGQRWSGLPVVTTDGERIGVVAYVVSNNAGTIMKVVADVAGDKSAVGHRIEIGGRYIVFRDSELQLTFDRQTFGQLLTSASAN